MIAQPREKRVGKEGLLYIKECLLEDSALALCVLEGQNLGFGTVTALLPGNVDPKAIRNFRAGGLWPQPDGFRAIGADGRSYTMVPTPNMDDWLAARMASFLAKHPRSACVFWDTYYDTHPNLEAFAFRHQQEVYRAVMVPEVNSILRLVREMNYLPYYVGFMVAGGLSDEVLESGEASGQHIRDIARRTEALSVLACDGETYLIWTRSDRASAEKP